jgi:hypothetical protein
MDNLTPEMALMDPEERAEVEFIWNYIPEEDRAGMTPDDVLFVLDKVDDYMEEKGLIDYDDATGEMTYADGEIDEEDQLNYILRENRVNEKKLTSVQIQLILDAELQYGIEQGWYEEED